MSKLANSLLLLGLCATAAADNTRIAKALGWVPLSDPNRLCQGVYVEPLLTLSALNLPNSDSISITADQSSLFISGQSHLKGNVRVVQVGQTAQADEAFLDRDGKTGRITRIELRGHVRMQQHGHLLLSDRAVYMITNNNGQLDNVTYRIARDEKNVIVNHETRLEGTNAWGQADKINAVSKDVYRIQNGTYATCPPTDTAWQISAKELTVDRKKNIGVAHHAKFKIRDMPVLYFPYLTFPVTKERKTGFLFPRIGYLGRSGVHIGTPFYWNIAPNYDLTLTPNAYSKRGLLMEGDFRYLTPINSGELYGAIVPYNKNSTPSALGYARGMVHYNNESSFTPNWKASVTYNAVSDSEYFQDFSGNSFLTTQTQLLQQIKTSYDSDHWNLFANVQNYQTLHPDSTIPVSNIYRRLPQLGANMNYGELPYGFDVQGLSEFVYFNWPQIGRDAAKPNADRIHFRPTISLPFEAGWGFVKPSIGLDYRYYNIDHQFINQPTQLNRFIPMLNVDSGLIFERDTNLFGKNFTNTLEPRVYYLYVPFLDQNAIPVFDSSYYIFNFSQLFRNNRFTGADRIGDSNQISYALTSRFIDDSSGLEKLKASVGIIQYFEKRRVQLCSPTFPCDNSRVIGSLNDNEVVSPIAGLLEYHVNHDWSVNASAALNPNNKAPVAQSADVTFRYQPDPKHLLNFGYSFLRNGDRMPTGSESRGSFNQIQTSTAWSLTKNWSTLGAFSYNLTYNHLQNAIAGLEYNSCCWAVRGVGGRTFDNLSATDKPRFQTVFYLQFLLKGLGNYGTGDETGLLETQIPGYRDWFKH